MINAAFIWIAGPLIAGLFGLLFFKGTPQKIFTASAASLFLILAIFTPPARAVDLLGINFYIEPVFTVLGRSFLLGPSDQSILMNAFGLAAFWFIGALGTRGLNSLGSYGLMIIGVLVAAISIQPFLYAGVFIELAILLSIPLLISAEKVSSKAILPYLIRQSLAFPFILLAGFLLSGINTPQTDLKIITQGILMLAIGFSFLLSIFPLYSWVPILSSSVEPYKLGFILTVFPFFSVLMGLDFIDRFTFLKNAEQFSSLLEGIGMLTVFTTGIFASTQDRLDRIYAYALVSMTGFGLIALSIKDHDLGVRYFIALSQIHFLVFALWGLGLSKLKHRVPSLDLKDVRGSYWRYPFVTAAILIPAFTLAGNPFLALFPIKLVLWEQIAVSFPEHIVFYGGSLLTFWISAARSFSWFFKTTGKPSEPFQENGWNIALILIAIILIIFIGIFPDLITLLDPPL